MRFYGRKYELRLKEPSGETVFVGGPENMDALDIEFDVTFSNSQCRKGTVSVYGLKLDRISKYVSLSALLEKAATSSPENRIRVTLKAGYEDPGMVDIIDGYVVSGRQSAPPEIKLTMTIDEAYNQPDCIVDMGFSTPTTLDEVIKKMIDPFGLSFVPDKNVIGLDKKVLAEKFKVPAVGKGGGRDMEATMSVIRGLISKANKNGTVSLRRFGNALWIIGESNVHKDIGKDDGLLSVSGITYQTADISMFLQDHGGVIFPWVNIKSEYNEHANGEYMVTEKRFVGQFRGNQWMTTYKCEQRRHY